MQTKNSHDSKVNIINDTCYSTVHSVIATYMYNQMPVGYY